MFNATAIISMTGVLAGVILVIYGESSAGTTIATTSVGSYFAYMRGDDNPKS